MSRRKWKPKKPAYMLRTCAADMTARGGFMWPESGYVEAPDWRDDTECGGGLHGLLWGEGDGALLSWESDARWLVVEVDAGEVRDLGGKIKVPRGNVVHCGDRASASQRIRELGARGAVAGLVASGGDGATVTGGNYATVTGGNYATVTGGNRATVTGGDGATVTGGNYATVTGGDGATVTGGVGATLSVRWWDGSRYRIAVAYVGEDGILPGVAYRVADGRFVEVLL